MVKFDYGKLKDMRREKGLTIAEVAERMGCAPATISRWELGLSAISAESFAKLASLYGGKVDEAFYRSLVDHDEKYQEAGGRDISNGKDDNNE